MKKSINTFIKAILVTLVISNLSFSAALAVDPPAPDTGNGTGGTAGSNAANPSVSESDLFYRFNYQGLKEGPGNVQTKIGAVSALPNKTWQETLAAIIKIMLNISGGLILIAMTVGGVFMVASGGKEEMVTKGKTIVIYSVIGIIIISVAYAVVIGVSQIQIFQPGTAGNNAVSGSNSAPTAPAQGGGVAGGATK
jgi:hypothetical protein